MNMLLTPHCPARLPRSSTPALLLFDWETGRRVGPELPEPLTLSWDPSRTMLAMAYPSQLLIVRWARREGVWRFALSRKASLGEGSLAWFMRRQFVSNVASFCLPLLSLCFFFPLSRTHYFRATAAAVARR